MVREYRILKSESWVHPNIKEIIENQGSLQENTRG
jgi:hypothetical protein